MEEEGINEQISLGVLVFSVKCTEVGSTRKTKDRVKVILTDENVNAL